MTVTAHLPKRKVCRKESPAPHTNRCAPAPEVVRPCAASAGIALSALHAACPVRPPNWRHRLALFLLDAGRHPPPRDHDLSRIFGLVCRLRRPDARPLPERLLPYALALRLHEDGDEDTRAVLEAALLARIPPEQAGRALGLPPGVAEAYAPTFYDVSDRLDRFAYMAGVLRLDRPPEPTLAGVLRAFAYSGGPRILDDLLRIFGLRGLDPASAGRVRDPELHQLTARVAVAVWLLPTAPRSARAHMELDLRFRRLDSRGHDPSRHRRDELIALRGHLRLVRRAFGAALGQHPFLVQLLAPEPVNTRSPR